MIISGSKLEINNKMFFQILFRQQSISLFFDLKMIVFVIVQVWAEDNYSLKSFLKEKNEVENHPIQYYGFLIRNHSFIIVNK